MAIKNQKWEDKNYFMNTTYSGRALRRSLVMNNKYTYPNILILVSNTETTMSLSNVTSLITSFTALSNSGMSSKIYSQKIKKWLLYKKMLQA